jgi:hypothetical protein
MRNDLFCYLADFGSVTSGDTYTVELPFASDSDFRITNIRTNLSSTTEAKISIKKESGEELSNAAFELRALTGENNGLNVFDSFVVKRGSKWTISANVSAGSSQPLQLQFWGFKQ